MLQAVLVPSPILSLSTTLQGEVEVTGCENVIYDGINRALSHSEVG